MTWLLTADWHLTDRPRDVHRFGLLPWLVEQQKKHAVTATFILGDLTDSKDRHSAALVNRLVQQMRYLVPPTYILMGNHDYVSPDTPFFGFLSQIEGLRFVTKPRWLKDLGVAMIPHCRSQPEFDQACTIIPKGASVMLHNTFEGAKAETGAALSGLRASPIEQRQPTGVWAGDVHVPQRTGPVTYVGAPFTIRFGDTFEPRCLLVRGTKQVDLHFDCPRKWALTIRDPQQLYKHPLLKPGDQVKITVAVTREEVVEWKVQRQWVIDACNKLGLDVYGVDVRVLGSKERDKKVHGVVEQKPKDILAAFCSQENVASNVRRAGMDLLK